MFVSIIKYETAGVLLSIRAGYEISESWRKSGQSVDKLTTVCHELEDLQRMKIRQVTD